MVQGKLAPEEREERIPRRSWIPEMFFRWMGRRTIHRISGESMVPALRAGEWIVVDRRAYDKTHPVPGDIVLARHPYRSDLSIVKRVDKEDAPGMYALRGDNLSESTDSRSFGSVSREMIVGKVVARTTAPRY